MIRNVDLVSYLPLFMADYQEINTTLTAENPEFRLVWEAADRVLKNEFIATADEYGLSRFEKLLQIFPSADDTIESRRARVQARWFAFLPYTWRMLIERLISICGENNFTLSKNFDFYQIGLEVSLGRYGQIEELDHLLNAMIPCNMVLNPVNQLPCRAEGIIYTIGGVCVSRSFFITNDSKESYEISCIMNLAGGIGGTEHFFITNDSKESFNAHGTAKAAGAAADTIVSFITNDSNESFSVHGRPLAGGGAVHLEIMGAYGDKAPVVTEDSMKRHEISGTVNVGGGLGDVEHFFITNDGKEILEAHGGAFTKGAVTDAAIMTITNDSNEGFHIRGKRIVCGGTVHAEIVEIIPPEDERR